MNVITKFMELNFSILSVFFFIFSLFVIFSMFKEWMLITKIIVFYLLNSLLIGILIMKFNIQIEKILNITSGELILIHIIFTAFLIVVALILMVIENERFKNKIKKMWFNFTSFFMLRLSYLPYIVFKLTKLIPVAFW